jgi:metacaspase-1
MIAAPTTPHTEEDPMATVKTPAAKKTALSLHLGLNTVSPAAYAGWEGPLAACEFDANDMAALAKSKGMKTSVLLTQKATRAALLAGLRNAARTLKTGDLFFLSFSGHGGQVKDTNRDETDGQDETWCLFDGQLIDDELYFELSRFAAGVRVLVLSDSCHSGSVTRDRLSSSVPPPPGQRPKLMPVAVGQRVYASHQALYDGLQADVAKRAATLRKADALAQGRAPTDPDAALALLAGGGLVGAAAQAVALVGAFKPSVVLISGCQDNQTSMDGEHNGAFTEQLLRVWNHGAFTGTYASLHARVRAVLPPTQSPNLFSLGPTAAFLKERPFSV